MSLSAPHLIKAALLVAAGVTLLIALQSLLVSRAGHRPRVYRSFAMLSLCVTVYLLATGWIYVAQDTVEASRAYRLQVAAMCVWLLPLYSFLAHLFDERPRSAVMGALGLLFGVLFVLNLTLPHGLRFQDLSRAPDLYLPWGEVLPLYLGEPTLAMRLLRAASIGVLLWAAVRALRLARSGPGNCRNGMLLAGSMALILAAAAWGALIDYGVVLSFYVVGFAFLGLVLVMSLSLARQLREQTSALQDSARELAIAAVAFETNDAIMVTDDQARILSVNAAFETITGYSKDEVVGGTPRLLRSGRHDAQFYKTLWDSLIDTGQWSGEIWDRHKSGRIYPKGARISTVRDQASGKAYFVAVFSDQTQQKKSEADLRHIERTDSLTGLPNRLSLHEALEQALRTGVAARSTGALLMVDLDRFKTLNDSLGHARGDMVLSEMAHRIRQAAAEPLMVARLGADEFMIVALAIGDRVETASLLSAQLAERVLGAISQPCIVARQTQHLTASIGVYLIEGPDVPVVELMRRVEIAMTLAKEAGGNQVRFFNPQIQAAFEHRARLEADLRAAIDGRQFELHYQVQVDAQHRPVGAEALLRWRHPQRGLVSPGEFIPIAESSELMNRVGRWTLDAACRQLCDWGAQAATRHLSLAVNISARQFAEPDFVEQVAHRVRQHGLDASRLKLELTESLALQDLEGTIARMNALRQEVGVKLSLDDFGTGFSSLSYLKRLPLDQIKIDQSFVRHSTTDPRDAVMLKAIIGLSRDFGFEVIAEGIETEAQLQLLHDCGCRCFQGYLFGRPVPIEAWASMGAVILPLAHAG